MRNNQNIAYYRRFPDGGSGQANPVSLCYEIDANPLGLA